MTKKTNAEAGVLVALVVIAGLVWYFGMRPKKGAITESSVAGSYVPLGVDNQELHWHRLKRVRQTEYAKTLRDIFSEIAPPPDAPVHPPTPGPKPGPVFVEKRVSPLPVKFYGYGIVPVNGARLAFFTDGEDVFIVGEGETLMGRFRILRIGNTNLEYEELSSGLRGTANLEEQGPSA
jgi:hypothetical protein